MEAGIGRFLKSRFKSELQPDYKSSIDFRQTLTGKIRWGHFLLCEIFKNDEIKLAKVRAWFGQLTWVVENAKIVKRAFLNENQLILIPQKPFYLALQGIGFFPDIFSQGLGLPGYILSRLINI